MTDRDTSVFLSDAHFGIPAGHRRLHESDFLTFLSRYVCGASHLFLVGDIFDFWIEYRHTVRTAYIPLITALKNLSDNGTTIHYCAGNHDFMLGPVFSSLTGARILYSPETMVLQNKRVHVFHGDGLLACDTGYRLLKRILRHPLNQFLYRQLPSDFAVRMASTCSRSSRKLLGKRLTEKHLAEYRHHANTEFRNGADMVVYGHTHTPELRAHGSHTYCNTGDWIRYGTFAVLEKGALTLWKYQPDDEAIPYSPQAENPSERMS